MANNNGSLPIRPTRTESFVWMGMLVAVLLVSLGNYQTYLLGTHFDDARYVILSRSLLISDHYGMINAPGDPLVGKYPFVYPLLLTPLLLLFPNNPDALKILSLIATVINISLLFWGWRWFSRTRSSWWGLAIAALYGLAPLTIDLTRRVMSEPVFTTFVLTAIILAERAAQKQDGWWWSLAMSASLVGVLYTRTVGIVLIACIFVYLILKRGKMFATQLAVVIALMAVIVGAVVALTSVQLRDLLPSEYLKDENAGLIASSLIDVPDGEAAAPSAADAPPDWINKIRTYVIDYRLIYGVEQHFGKDVRTIAFPLGGGAREEAFAQRLGLPFLPMLLGYTISAIVLFGWFRQFRQEGLTLLNLFATVYFTALFLWGWNDPRLLYPIQPQLQLGFLLGIEALVVLIATRARVGSPQMMLAGIAIALITIATMKDTQIDDSRLHTGDIRARTAWLAKNAAPSALILTEAPEIDYLYSERKTSTYPSVASAAQLEEYLLARNIDYVLIAPLIRWQQSYKPEYSKSALEFRGWLEELAANQRATLVYASEPELLSVYKVTR